MSTVDWERQRLNPEHEADQHAAKVRVLGGFSVIAGVLIEVSSWFLMGDSLVVLAIEKTSTVAFGW